MPTLISSGTITPSTLGTEQDFTTADTTNKTYVLVVDTVHLTGVEVVEFAIYTIVLAAGTERVAYRRAYTGPQSIPIKYSPPVPANISFKARLTQTGGTLRAYPWAILAL
jgi:hypothetical protein